MADCSTVAFAQTKADGCSSAQSGMQIGVSVTVICLTPGPLKLSQEQLEELKEGLIRSGQVARAEQAGVSQSWIFRLAEQLQPGENFDLDQAKKTIEVGIAVAVKIRREGKEITGDALLDEVRRRIAENTKKGNFKDATAAAEQGFAEWEKAEAAERAKEAQRRAASTRQGVALLEAAFQTDLLRFDAEAAAGRVEKIVALEHDGDHKAQFEALRKKQDRFYVEGRDKGINFQLQVAIAIARREVAMATGADERGAALNDLGAALSTLGERESGTARLEEAVKAYRAALEEYKRERVPHQWAMAQNNLDRANALLEQRRKQETNKPSRK